MRKFIVNHFGLDYMSKCFGLSIKFTRGASIIFPCLVLASIISMLVPTLGIIGNLLIWLPFIVSIYFGFFYFRTNPIKFSELTDVEQIYQFGAGHLSGDLSSNSMTDEDWVKFDEARIKIEEIDEMKFYKPYRFIMHPFVIVPLCIMIVLLIFK